MIVNCYHPKWLIGSLLTVLLLTGCHKSNYFQPVSWRQQDPTCTTNDCASLEISYPRYFHRQELNHTIQKQLLYLANWQNNNQTPAYSDWQQYSKAFFAAAHDSPGPAWQAIIKAEPLYDHQHVLTIELESYLYTGGAHGMPMTQFLMWDKANNQPLHLTDLFLPNKINKLIELEEKAYQSWLKEKNLLKPSYLQLWPFVPNTNVALSPQGLIVKYNVYEIAPYVEGQVEWTIQYNQLTNILNPRFLPSAQ